MYDSRFQDSRFYFTKCTQGMDSHGHFTWPTLQALNDMTLFILQGEHNKTLSVGEVKLNMYCMTQGSF